MGKIRLALTLIGALGAVLLALPADAADPVSTAAPATYTPQGAQTCLNCHKEPEVMALLGGPHAVKGDPHAPFGQHDCESCHGPSQEHAAGRGRTRPEPAVVFIGPNASPVEVRNNMCLSCHQSGLRLHWQGSQHESNNVACTNCHNPHTQKDPMLVRTTQPQVCFTCHTQQRAQTLQLSHHPIREGKVICSDCHNPHGSVGPKLVKENTVNETCYNCHAEKRGPLLFEHEPVREDCTNCHTPHGSIIASLLKERLPYLCENCHGGAGGHNGTPFAGQNLPGGNNTLATTLFLQNAQLQINARGCINCHSVIHGSNSPGGLYFTR